MQRYYIGDRLRAERHRQNISKKALAEMAGLSTETLERFERNERSVPITTMYSLARGLDIPMRWLWDKSIRL